MHSWGVNMRKLSCRSQCLYSKPGCESHFIWPFVLQQHPEASSHSENVFMKGTLAWSALLGNKVPRAQSTTLRPAHSVSAGGTYSGMEVCVCRLVPENCTGDQVYTLCPRLSSGVGVDTSAAPLVQNSPQGLVPRVYRISKWVHTNVWAKGEDQAESGPADSVALAVWRASQAFSGSYFPSIREDN